MQEFNFNRNLFIPDNYKYVEINKTKDSIHQNNFKQGLQNARNLLDSLERSLQKSTKYEEKLLKCKMSHDHSHNSTFCWSSDSDTAESKYSMTGKPEETKNSVNVMESWSTISIVCLQYQYEELSKRYKTLLQAYEKRGISQNAYKEKLLKLRRRLKCVQAELTDMNLAVITVGEKYLALKEKKMSQKVWYEERIERLKIALCAILDAIEQAHFALN